MEPRPDYGRTLVMRGAVFTIGLLWTLGVSLGSWAQELPDAGTSQLPAEKSATVAATPAQGEVTDVVPPPPAAAAPDQSASPETPAPPAAAASAEGAVGDETQTGTASEARPNEQHEPGEAEAPPARTPPVRVLAASAAPAPHDKKAKTVSSADLAKLGFFQDFQELDLETLLNPDVLSVTTTVASGREQPLEEAPGAVTVLTADDLRDLGARTLTDVLRLVAGFDVVTDSLGRSRIVARGVPSGGFAALSENVLVMLNGHRLDDAISGGAMALNFDMPIEGIAKIEILRGPASARYGSGALAAVVNVLTEEAGSFRGVRASSTAGSFGTYQEMVRLNNEIMGIKVLGSMRYVSTSGPDPTIVADAQTLRDASSVGDKALSLSPGPAAGGFHALETYYHVTFRNYELHWRVFQGTSNPFVGYANSLGDQGNTYSKQSDFDLGYHDELKGVGALKVRLNITNNDQSQLFEVLPPGFVGVLLDGRRFEIDSPIFLKARLKTGRVGVDATLERGLGRDHQLLAGLTLEREATRDLEAQSNLDFSTRQPYANLTALPDTLTPATRRSAGLFVQDVWSLSQRVTITGGLRLDSLNDAGTRLSPRLAVVTRLPRDLTLKVLYGEAFRVPTFAELYFNLPGYEANPNLKSVTARSLNAQLGLRRTNLRLNAGAFTNWVRNTIPAERPASAFDRTVLVNMPGINVYGIEAEGRATLGINALFGNVTLQSSRYADVGGSVPGVAAFMTTLGATVAVGPRQSLTGTWLLRSSRPRAADDPRPALGGCGVLNLAFHFTRVLRDLDASAMLDNLLGQKYEDPAPAFTLPGDYPRPGRSIRILARYSF
jgi:outer membrane receptor for ferrienterochelin and colicins